MIIKYFKIACKIVHALAYYYCTLLIPKDKKLWVFGSWKGKSYSDNSKALFEYVSKEHKEINAVWIAKNEKVYNEVLSLGFNVVRYSSFTSKILVARAKVSVQTESNEDTGRFRVGGTKVIQLFHGAAAVKEVHLFHGMSKIKKALVKIYADNHTKSYWMVASDYYLHRYPLLVEADPQRIYVTGQPRTDVVLEYRKSPFLEEYISTHGKKKLIIYAPTHRNYGAGKHLMFSPEEWLRFDDFLGKENYILFFKPHPNEIELYKEQFNDYKNILLVDERLSLPKDSCEYLHYFDLLISDYSSIASDFIILNKPLIHFMFDFDHFADEDFTLDSVDKFVGGPICKNWNDLFDSIKDSLDNDSYYDKRQYALKRAYKYVDRRNCERVYDRILEIIK